LGKRFAGPKTAAFIHNMGITYVKKEEPESIGTLPYLGKKQQKLPQVSENQVQWPFNIIERCQNSYLHVPFVLCHIFFAMHHQPTNNSCLLHL